MSVRRMADEYRSKYTKVGEQQTLSEAIAHFIEAQTAVLSPYTLRGYQYTLDAINRTEIAKLEADMSRSDAQKIVSLLIHENKSPKTIRNYISLISASVKFAGFSMPQITLPQNIKPESKIPTEGEMRHILSAAEGTPLEIPIALGMMGLRRGEICALTLEDLNGSVFHIHASAVDLTYAQFVKAPKTFESDRYVHIPDAVADKIREQGYVTHLTPERISKRFMRFMKKQGFEGIRFHDLRHFFASYCHNILRLSDAQIQMLGGWKTDYVMKKIYIQSMQNEEAAAQAAGAFSCFIP